MVRKDGGEEEEGVDDAGDVGREVGVEGDEEMLLLVEEKTGGIELVVGRCCAGDAFCEGMREYAVSDV